MIETRFESHFPREDEDESGKKLKGEGIQGNNGKSLALALSPLAWAHGPMGVQ